MPVVVGTINLLMMPVLNVWHWVYVYRKPFCRLQCPARRPWTISASRYGAYRDKSWMVQWLSTASIGRDSRRRIREVLTTTAWRWRCKSKSHCNSWYTKHSRCHNNSWHLLVWRHTELLTSCWRAEPIGLRYRAIIWTFSLFPGVASNLSSHRI